MHNLLNFILSYFTFSLPQVLQIVNNSIIYIYLFKWSERIKLIKQPIQHFKLYLRKRRKKQKKHIIKLFKEGGSRKDFFLFELKFYHSQSGPLELLSNFSTKPLIHHLCYRNLCELISKEMPKLIFSSPFSIFQF